MQEIFLKKYGPIKDRLKAQNIEGLCLDIDDTLCDTNLFWAETHMKNFGNPENLTAREIIEKYRYASKVPYWGNNSEAEAWILANCNDVYGRLNAPQVSGALDAVTKIQQITPLSAYLTGRPEQISKGTQLWLSNNKFPQLELLSLPSLEELKQMGFSTTHQWKANVLDYMYPQINGIIDDNIDLVNAIPDDYKGNVYIFSHENKNLKNQIFHYVPTWNDVVKQIIATVDSNHISFAYDKVANAFHETRTKNKGLSGLGHRQIEQPYMFSLVSQKLNNLNLLDLGCGPGIHAKEYQKRGANVFGIDISKEMVAIAKKEVPEGDFQIKSVQNTGFENNFFDIITSSLLFDHLHDLEPAFDEIQRILKQNGEFIFSVPHPMLSIIDFKNFNLNGSYFDKSPKYFSVANNPELIKAYHHKLTDYFQVSLKKGFYLKEFIENEPLNWDFGNYETLKKLHQNVPQQCFFSWVKK